MQLRRLNLEFTMYVIILIFLALFPLFASDFRMEIMGKIIVLIIFAIAVDLVWGYTGLLSFGHAVFFGLGGYILALSYTFQNGVPNFMARFDLHEIPVFMKPLLNIPLAFLLGMMLPALLAFIIGYFIFKSKVSGVYFSIITLVLAQLFPMLIINLQAYTGGANGLMGLPRFPVFGRPLSLFSYYYLVLLIAIAVYLFAKWLTSSHFGKTIKSISENESRARFLSYNAGNYKIFIFAVSGFISGLAGMLYVPMNGFISPQDTGIMMSTLVIIWLAVGGRGYLMGAVVGTLIMNWLSELLSEQYPEIWSLFLGLILVVIVIFLPHGIYGSMHKWLAAYANRREKYSNKISKVNRGVENAETTENS